MAEFVQQILATEKKAGEILERAEHEKTKVTARAREKAIELMTLKKKENEQAIDKEMKQRMTRIEEKKKKILDQYYLQAEQVGKKAEKQIGKAAAFVLSKLREGESSQ